MKDKIVISIPDPVTEGVLPESASMSGKNAFYHYCEAWNGRQNYAVCRHAMKAYEEERLPKTSLCFGAIKCKSCEALPMKAAEINSGRSLYFIDRTKQMEANKLRMAERGSIVDKRVRLGGIGSMLEKSRKQNPTQPSKETIIERKPKQKSGDIDHLIHEGSKAIETALSDANKEK